MVKDNNTKLIAENRKAYHEYFIEDDPAVDAEVVSFAWNFFALLGLTGIKVLLNSVGCPTCAPPYVEKLRAAVAGEREALCEDCRRRYVENPLRMLDCKVCRDRLAAAPRLVDGLCEECAGHLQAVQGLLGQLSVPFEMDYNIVRGLDYYTKTAFEFQIEGIGSQSALGGGGRYDGLVEKCGGHPTPGVGLGMGLERLLLARQNAGLGVAGAERSGVFVVTLGDAAWTEGLKLAQELRLAGLRAEVDYRRRSMKAQLRFADGEGFLEAIVLGEDELASGQVALKNLESGEQQSVPRGELLERLRQP